MDIARIVERNGHAHEFRVAVFPLSQELLDIFDREVIALCLSLDELRVEGESLSGLHRLNGANSHELHSQSPWVSMDFDSRSCIQPVEQA